jgi:hypothetical protein
VRAQPDEAITRRVLEGFPATYALARWHSAAPSDTQGHLRAASRAQQLAIGVPTAAPQAPAGDSSGRSEGKTRQVLSGFPVWEVSGVRSGAREGTVRGINSRGRYAPF